MADVLERRNILCHNARTETKPQLTMRTMSTQRVLQQELKKTNISGHCENNVINRQFTYNTNLMQNILIKQNPRAMSTQHEKEYTKVPSNAATTPVARQESQAVRASRIIVSVAWRL
ncbi:hypothetical protein KIN20_030522 [Parelaphostrongylus tenuis]|uniref:Uncharacterized protein n=1 Tax=Parelaphostrongylus tenuis TaxID=148309 RepID=A0AAD5WG66_PARTN|nr:hypothetical protein KIN20_030522 [Parelaphostrongylus tenuis]